VPPMMKFPGRRHQTGRTQGVLAPINWLGQLPGGAMPTAADGQADE
jgi:hypothetical protein